MQRNSRCCDHSAIQRFSSKQIVTELMGNQRDLFIQRSENDGSGFGIEPDLQFVACQFSYVFFKSKERPKTSARPMGFQNCGNCWLFLSVILRAPAAGAVWISAND